MSYLQNIAGFAADNIGGLLQIQVARKADVVSIPEPVAGIVYGDITFLPGKGFVAWSVTNATPGADSNTRQSREGTSKGSRLKFSVPKDRTALRVMFEQATEDEFIILFKDANGQQKLFGLLTAPVRFRFNLSTGSSVAAKNGYDCEFFYDGPENMFEYNGAVATPPAGAAPAVVYFNGVAIASLLPGQSLNIESDYSFTEYFITS